MSIKRGETLINTRKHLANLLHNYVNELVASVALAMEIFWTWADHLDELRDVSGHLKEFA